MVPLHKVGPRDGELWLFLPALAMTLGVLGYLAAFLLPRLFPENETVRAERTEWRDTVDAEAVVVRQERLLLSNRTGLRMASESGQRLPAGAAAAVVYDSGTDYLRGELLLRLRRTLSDAQNALSFSPERDAAALRRAAAMGDFPAALETADRTALSLLPAEERSAALEALSAEIEALELSGAADSVLAAAESGFLFSDTDGFEALSPEGELTAGALRAALGAKSTTLPGVLRLLTGSGWLLCVPVTAGEADLFAPGDTVTAELRGRTFTVRMKSVLAGDGEERWLLFSCREGLEAVSSCRATPVSLVLFRAEGYPLPASALRFEGGETAVYRMAGPVVRREVVTVLAEDGDTVLVDGAGLRPGALVLTGEKEYTDGAVP